MNRFFLLAAVFVPAIVVSSIGRASGGDGDEVGNGGNVVLCTGNGGSPEVELFDYFEARLLNPAIVFDLGSPSLSAEEKVEYVLKRLEGVSPQRAANYRAFIQSIWTDSHFTDSDLVSVDDSHNAVMPKNCSLKQVALHLKPQFDPYGKKVLINRPLYLQLDESGKAGLFLHEAIYNEWISFGGGENSSGVRYFNAAISSQTDLSLKSFINLLTDAGLRQYEFHGLWLELYDPNSAQSLGVDFYPDTGVVEDAIFIGSDQKLLLKSGTTLMLSDDVDGAIQFRPDGTMSSIEMDPMWYVFQNQVVGLIRVDLDPNEHITEICVSSLSEVSVVLHDVNNRPIEVMDRTLLKLDDSENIIASNLSQYCDDNSTQ
jgi:hypothetical protein